MLFGSQHGTSNGNDADALPVGFEQLIVWTRGNSLHPTSPSVHDDNIHSTSPSAHDDNSLAMQPNTKRNGSDPSSAIEIGCNDGDEDKPRPPGPRPALVVCQLQGTLKQIFQRAFDKMLDFIVDTPCLLDVNIAGVNMDKKDALTLVSPRWYTDALIDVLRRIAHKGSNYRSVVSYQDEITIEAHIPRVAPQGHVAQLRNQQSLLDWCTKIRSLEIEQPEARWPCARISSDCLTIVFAWSPFNNHWVALEFAKAGPLGCVVPIGRLVLNSDNTPSESYQFTLS
jgi:hypothetical protein